MSGHALIVEDDVDAARMVAALVSGQGFSAATAPSLHDARKQLALQPADLLLLDLRLPDGNGLSLLDEQDLVGQPEIVLMTGHASLETSIAALRHGALDYLIKPVSAGQLQGTLARMMKPAQREAAAGAVQHTLRHDVARSGRFGLLVGRSDSMRRVYEQVARVAGTSVTVFITGESGTGKELVAQTVHDLSRRKSKPFLAVNCGAISPHLIESEIFGHERGLICGIGNPWAELFAPNRKAFHAMGEYFKEQGNVARQYADWLKEGEVKDLSAIAPGAGALYRQGVKLLAVHRDAGGQLHARSAACTHLGCAVHWNPVEKSWDCPCHASRFSPDGQVLHGPATKPLAPEQLDKD